MTNNTTTRALIKRARENISALTLVSQQEAFKGGRSELGMDLQLAAVALTALESRDTSNSIMLRVELGLHSVSSEFEQYIDYHDAVSAIKNAAAQAGISCVVM